VKYHVRVYRFQKFETVVEGDTKFDAQDAAQSAVERGDEEVEETELLFVTIPHKKERAELVSIGPSVSARQEEGDGT